MVPDAMSAPHAAWIECHQCHHRWIAILDAGDFGDALGCPACDKPDGWLVRGFDTPSAAELRRWPADERDMYLRASADYAIEHGYPDDHLDGDFAAQYASGASAVVDTLQAAGTLRPDEEAR